MDVTLRLEAAAVAAAQVTNLVEKRLHRVLDARFSGLPETFLAAERLGAMLDNLEAALACEFVALPSGAASAWR